MREAKPRRVGDRWQIRLTDEHGKRRKSLFNDYVDAMKALTAEKARVAEVKDGLRDPTPADRTFDELADYWEKNRVPQKRSGQDDISILRKHLRPFFGAMRLKDIGRAETDRYQLEKQNQKVPLDPKTVANHLTLLIATLNLAVDLGWLLKPARIKKPRVRLFDKDYRYLRTEEELARFLVAAQEEGELATAIYSTAVYTGMRAGELAGLRWDCVNFERRLITVQYSFDGPTKGGEVRYVPILDPLLPVLKHWRLRCPGQLVFPNQWGQMQCESARVFQDSPDWHQQPPSDGGQVNSGPSITADLHRTRPSGLTSCALSPASFASITAIMGLPDCLLARNGPRRWPPRPPSGTRRSRGSSWGKPSSAPRSSPRTQALPPPPAPR